MYEDVFEKVEKVLQSFPIECQKNYYKNKKTLIVKKGLSKNSYGSYDNNKNIITLYEERALSHELFHMAFRDKKKMRKKLCKGGVLTHSNGISYVNPKTQTMGGVGLTEGFTEYLSRKCTEFKGHRYLYFFADLLISIYGEDILKYPLKNDVIGLVGDERFFSITNFIFNMDDLIRYAKIISYLDKNSTVIDKILETNTKKENMELSEKIIVLRDEFGKVIIKLFHQIIDEYSHCNNPMISKKDFIDKMKKIINSDDYNIPADLKCENAILLKEVEKIVDDFSNTKVIIK